MIIIGLGTNLEDSTIFTKAIFQILSHSPPLLSNIKLSPIYSSKALLPKSAPTDWNKPYLNMAISGETKREPIEVLEILKKIEKNLGRKTSEKWAPRTIDLDILCWDDLTMDSSQLQLPHPGLIDRPFALWPLCDLNSQWIHPKIHKSALQLGSQWQEKIPFNTRRTGSLIPELVGIINFTPDSFSESENIKNVEQAIEIALKMVQNGATVLDIGAESTRPGATLLTAEQEWKRVSPLLKELKEELSKLHYPPQISIDTRHWEVAKEATLLGVDWINDVSGLDQKEMISVVKESNVKVIVMHHLDIPPNPHHTLPNHLDPIDLIYKWGKRRFLNLYEQGISPTQIIFDPGIGFGKSPLQSFQIISKLHQFFDLNVPILLGHSRKSFLNLVTNKPYFDRDLETSILSFYLSSKNHVNYLRVHNIETNREALLLNYLLKGSNH